MTSLELSQALPRKAWRDLRHGRGSRLSLHPREHSFGQVRTEEQGAAIVNLGIQTIYFDDWDESIRLETIAEGFDIILHVGAGWHPGAARALITGQGKRRSKTGHNVHYFHLSGTTSLSDYPHTEVWVETRTFSDEEDTYSYLKSRESTKPYKVRETDILVVGEGKSNGVQTYIAMAPTIFGLGSSLFNQYSIQIPVMAQAALKSGQMSALEDGGTTWGHVHVEDLAMLFVVMLERVLEGVAIPSGQSGIYFSETGTHTHMELAQKISKAGKELGLLKTDAIKKVHLQEAADIWSGGVALHAELAYGSNARTKAVLGRKLGWVPLHAAEWETTVATEISAIIAKPPRSFEVPALMKNGES
ncbi:NAD dependent epimerase/dehydratase family protein [Dactylonectria estremocensis]|uniref:NAD dependent epimerase/dehydratase family protein n=1 Tax=Dactylonectria estremocensis TaxID=1079267 RepID=A0A9P9IJY6_9HYPO|nr:NAD dependent epimerase/dehydratase family protein [Dactylonectria estremocensis]